MFKNYLKIAIRNLIKNKTYSFINIAGLAIGLAGFILISTFIKNELSYDTFHKNADRIYRPVEIQYPPKIASQHVAVTMGPLAKALKEDFPEVEKAARIWPVGTAFLRFGNTQFYERGVAFADGELFDIFTIPFINGDPKTALAEPYSLVINEEVAEKFFPNEDPMGKSIQLENWTGGHEFTITGVIKNYPRNSHVSFRMLGSFNTFEEKFSWLKSWHSNSMATYILLQNGVQAAELEAKFPAFLKKYIEDKSWNKDLELYLQPLKDIHLYSDHIKFQTYNSNQGSINDIYTFSIIAIFILLIACINFMNLSTARSVKRAKEVGLRKVLGSRRKDLIYQFLGESVIISFIALLLGIILVQLALPFFREISGDRLFLNFYEYKSFLLELIAIALVSGIIAGSYPAFFLSSYQPIQTLKGNFNVTAEGRSSTLRKVLVVTQFAIAIVLIINTGIVIDQMRYIRNKDIGFNKEQIVFLPLRSDQEKSKIEVLKTALSENPNIVRVSAASGENGMSGSQSTRTVAGTNGETNIMMRIAYVDFDFIKTMEMEIIEGRDFSREFATDTSEAIIINETAVRELGWSEPLGKQFEHGDEGKTATVIGVLKDFHYNKLTQEIEPVYMSFRSNRFNYLQIRIRPENIPATLDFIESTWREHLPDRPYEFDFLDEHFAEIYQAEENVGKLFGAFAFIAIFVACLGLFGLASFTTEQKMKEIGIRKVLGASVGGIVMMLSKRFLKWVAIASVLAFPLAYFTGEKWLDNFVYHTDINLLIFGLAAILVVLVALFTVSFQAIRAALSNPVKALRYE